jgi:hypothetical protein
VLPDEQAAREVWCRAVAAFTATRPAIPDATAISVNAAASLLILKRIATERTIRKPEDVALALSRHGINWTSPPPDWDITCASPNDGTAIRQT